MKDRLMTRALHRSVLVAISWRTLYVVIRVLINENNRERENIMVEITDALVAKLGELTGADEATCKKALVDSDGDVVRAAEILVGTEVSEPVDASEAEEIAFVASQTA